MGFGIRGATDDWTGDSCRIVSDYTNEGYLRVRQPYGDETWRKDILRIDVEILPDLFKFFLEMSTLLSYAEAIIKAPIKHIGV